MPDIAVQDLIRQEATKQGVPPELALAIGEQESGFNPTLFGPTLPSGEQAVGTMQILPSTAKRLGIDATDPVQNIQGGVRYLRQLLDTHQGDLGKVLAEYGGVRSNTTYVPQVLDRIPKFATTTSQTPPPAAPPKSAVDQAFDDLPAGTGHTGTDTSQSPDWIAGSAQDPRMGVQLARNPLIRQAAGVARHDEVSPGLDLAGQLLTLSPALFMKAPGEFLRTLHLAAQTAEERGQPLSFSPRGVRNFIKTLWQGSPTPPTDKASVEKFWGGPKLGAPPDQPIRINTNPDDIVGKMLQRPSDQEAIEKFHGGPKLGPPADRPIRINTNPDDVVGKMLQRPSDQAAIDQFHGGPKLGTPPDQPIRINTEPDAWDRARQPVETPAAPGTLSAADKAKLVKSGLYSPEQVEAISVRKPSGTGPTAEQDAATVARLKAKSGTTVKTSPATLGQIGVQPETPGKIILGDASEPHFPIGGGYIPKTTSKGPMSATDGLTVKDVEAIGGDPQTRYTHITENMRRVLLQAREGRATLNRTNKSIDAAVNAQMTKEGGSPSTEPSLPSSWQAFLGTAPQK